MGWFARSFPGTPPPGLADWAERQGSPRSAWERCERADWLVWMAAKLPNLDEDAQRHVVMAAAAPLLPPRFRDAFTPWPRAVDLAVAWAGDAPRLQAADVVAALNLGLVTGLLCLPFLRLGAFGVALAVAGAVVLLRLVILDRRVAAMGFTEALRNVLGATARGVSRAGPRARAAQAQLVRESLSFVRKKL